LRPPVDVSLFCPGGQSRETVKSGFPSRESGTAKAAAADATPRSVASSPTNELLVTSFIRVGAVVGTVGSGVYAEGAGVRA
jgi:hypothetical protein